MKQFLKDVNMKGHKGILWFNFKIKLGEVYAIPYKIWGNLLKWFISIKFCHVIF